MHPRDRFHIVYNEKEAFHKSVSPQVHSSLDGEGAKVLLAAEPNISVHDFEVGQNDRPQTRIFQNAISATDAAYVLTSIYTVVLSSKTCQSFSGVAPRMYSPHRGQSPTSADHIRGLNHLIQVGNDGVLGVDASTS